MIVCVVFNCVIANVSFVEAKISQIATITQVLGSKSEKKLGPAGASALRLPVGPVG